MLSALVKSARSGYRHIIKNAPRRAILRAAGHFIEIFMPLSRRANNAEFSAYTHKQADAEFTHMRLGAFVRYAWCGAHMSASYAAGDICSRMRQSACASAEIFEGKPRKADARMGFCIQSERARGEAFGVGKAENKIVSAEDGEHVFLRAEGKSARDLIG